jgi:hypothetical protein
LHTSFLAVDSTIIIYKSDCSSLFGVDYKIATMTPKPRKSNKRNLHITVRAIKRAEPDYEKLSKALLNHLFEEIGLQTRFLAKIEEQDSRIVEELLDHTRALRLGDYHFLLIIDDKLACCLPPRMYSKAMKQFPDAGYLAPPKSSERLKGWVVLPSSAKSKDWLLYSLASVRYAIKLNPR